MRRIYFLFIFTVGNFYDSRHISHQRTRLKNYANNPVHIAICPNSQSERNPQATPPICSSYIIRVFRKSTGNRFQPTLTCLRGRRAYVSSARGGTGVLSYGDISPRGKGLQLCVVRRWPMSCRIRS